VEFFRTLILADFSGFVGLPRWSPDYGTDEMLGFK